MTVPLKKARAYAQSMTSICAVADIRGMIGFEFCLTLIGQIADVYIVLSNVWLLGSSESLANARSCF